MFGRIDRNLLPLAMVAGACHGNAEKTVTRAPEKVSTMIDSNGQPVILPAARRLKEEGQRPEGVNPVVTG